MRIQMQSTPMIIEMQTQRAVTEIDQEPASIDMRIKHPKVRVESTLPKVEISQQQAFSESGLKGVLELTFENGQRAKQLLLQGVGRVSSQGDEKTQIHKPDPTPDHAQYNAYEQFKKDYNIETMPKSGPDIRVIEGQLDIQVDTGVVNMDVQVNKPQIDVAPGKVNVKVKQYNSLKIDVIESEIDIRI